MNYKRDTLLTALAAILMTAISSLVGSAQVATPTSESDAHIVLQKQIAIDELERQVQDTPLTAIRVFVRMRIATWLWSSGNDDTGRAEELVSRAVSELYDKRDEIPPDFSDRLSASLFVLLDRNSPVMAKKLREKYNAIGSDLQAWNILPARSGDDTRTTDTAIKSIVEKGVVELDVLPLLIQLRSRNQAQYKRLLGALIRASEGPHGLTNSQVYLFAEEFLRHDVPSDIQKAFLKIGFNRCRMAAYGPSPDSYFSDLLSKMIPALNSHLPELLPEASVVQVILTSRLSASARATAERHERISKSADKLSAYLKEGDDVSDRSVRYEMFVSAAQLALRQEKFLEALKILDKVDGIDLPSGEITKEFRSQWRASFLMDTVDAALKTGEIEAASLAIRRIEDSLSKADMLRKKAARLLELGDLVSAKESLNESIKLAAKEEAGLASAWVLVRLLVIGQKIDPGSVVDLNRNVAKALGSLSAPKDSFEADRKAHLTYAKGVLDISWNLLPVVQSLAKANRTAASDFVGRIDKKEFRVVADLALVIHSFDRPNSTQPPRN